MIGGRYRLKQVLPSRLTQPPFDTRRPLINIGSPGAQVICSTALFLSSHALAESFCRCPLLSRTGLPSSSTSGTGSMREFTLDAGHISRVG